MESRLSRLALAVALAVSAGSAAAHAGYLSTSGDLAVRSGTGTCWHTGEWSQADAFAGCDAVPKVALATPQPKAAKPLPAPAPAAAPKPLAHLSLDAQLLFGFDRARLSAAGREKLDELARSLRDAKVSSIDVTGYTDRIAPAGYNRALSERRAEAVKDYLAARGIGEALIHAEGRGKADPVTGDKCLHLGPENRWNKKLISCLQPDRRVEIEAQGTRATASAAKAHAGS